MKSLLFFFLFIKYLFAYEDLGTYGELKEIKERDLMELFVERAKQIDYVKLEQEIKENIDKTFKIKSNIPNCNLSKQRTYEPQIEIAQDLKIPYTDINIKEKSSKYNVLKENNLFFPFNIIFIDADDELQVDLARYYKNSWAVN